VTVTHAYRTNGHALARSFCLQGPKDYQVRSDGETEHVHVQMAVASRLRFARLLAGRGGRGRRQALLPEGFGELRGGDGAHLHEDLAQWPFGVVLAGESVGELAVRDPSLAH
jgi:hypothetical protein